MIFRNIVLLCIILFLILNQILAMSKVKNQKADRVEFTEFYSIVQVTVENSNLVFRASFVPKTLVIVNKYEFFKEEGLNNKYIFILYQKAGIAPPDPNIKQNSPIEYTKWGGLRITVPNVKFNPEIDRIFYRDSKGDHKIIYGTKDSWRNYIEKEFRRLGYPESKLQENLQDI